MGLLTGRLIPKARAIPLVNVVFPAPHYFAIDTLATSKAFEPYLPNHKLDTVSEALNINLWHHHNALSDSEACAGILIEENKRVGDDPIKKMVKPI